MEYRQIVAVTGLGGLYQLVSTKNDGAIVRNLADKSVRFVSARVHHVTPLESIEIYTYSDNVRLHKVLEGIKENDNDYQNLNISKDDNKTLRAFFKKALPDFDEERVYVSDIKKILKWYDILKANDLLNFEVQNQEAAEAGSLDNEDEPEIINDTDEPVKEKPVKKAAKKATVIAADNNETEKPAKKIAAKKSTKKESDAEEKPVKKTAKKKAE